MKLFISILEIIVCINFLFAVSYIFIKKISFPHKPSYQLHLARLLFLSCILSPIAVHFFNLPQKNIFSNMMTSHIVKTYSYSSVKNKIDEDIDEASIATSSKPDLDFTYLYLLFSIIFVAGVLYRVYKIWKDIHKTKSIIYVAQPYKKAGKITIKISDQCVIPFSVRFGHAAYIILPVSILHSSINTKLAIAHEGQHHRQGDCLWAYIIEFMQIIFWFNPILIYLHRVFQELQELACDEKVISKSRVTAHDYGSCLFSVTKTASESQYNCHQKLVAQMVFKSKNQNSLITKRICMLSQYKSYGSSKVMLASVLVISTISIVGPLTAAYAAKSLISHNASDELNSIDTASINPKIQAIALKEISQIVNSSHAKSGAIVIADAHTGKVVAFAEAGKLGKNNSWASRIFNPASTIKPFIAAAAIDSGVVSASTMVDCNQPYKIDGQEFTNSNPKISKLSVADAMTNSVNICMIKVAQETGATKSRQILSRFGFDMNAAWNKNNTDALNLANTAMGSSIPVTLATLTNAYIILANKGHLIDINSGNAVSEETANSVTHLLEKVVNNGTGKRAAIANVSVAGKTGTLSDDAKALALFAGYVPANSPRYVSVVVVENAQINHSLSKANGGNVAAPTFRRALEKVLLISRS
jgi:beta-lactamase regulating signal transducer with metallopeptidase domain/beta-lactamase class D